MTSQAPLVSAVVIVQNAERYLAQALQSIREQSYSPVEVLVVDGRSTDGTEAVARSFPEVRFFTQPGSGTADAYNAGIEAARGELIAFLSHDDLWTPTKLERQVAWLRREPELDFVWAQVRCFAEDPERLPASFKRELLDTTPAVRIMETLLARRGAFERVGLLDPAFSPADDVEWFARAKDLGARGEPVPETLLLKRIHDANTSLQDPQRNNALLLQILHASVQRAKRGGT